MLNLRQFPDKEADSAKELSLDFFLRTAEKTANRGPKKHFIRKEGLEIRCLLEALMARNRGTAF